MHTPESVQVLIPTFSISQIPDQVDSRLSLPSIPTLSPATNGVKNDGKIRKYTQTDDKLTNVKINRKD